jgi:sigma-B regulation protein RsbU (phosphoserine phosphatase)
MMKTLIAEDDRDQREALSLLLHSEGYDVVEAASGIEAWHEFEQSRFTLVLSDWLMPELDGLELCRRIRATERPYYPYVILLTALRGKDHFLQAMSAGIDDFISKPFDADELRAKLHVAQRIVTLQDRVQRLEGILPTCMYCKKIRDKNQIWVRIEQYITERSNAAFSHGVCPDCLAKASAQLGNTGL